MSFYKNLFTAFLLSIDYFVYLWRQGVAALRPLLRSRSATLCPYHMGGS